MPVPRLLLLLLLLWFLGAAFAKKDLNLSSCFGGYRRLGWLVAWKEVVVRECGKEEERFVHA